MSRPFVKAIPKRTENTSSTIICLVSAWSCFSWTYPVCLFKLKLLYTDKYSHSWERALLNKALKLLNMNKILCLYNQFRLGFYLTFLGYMQLFIGFIMMIVFCKEKSHSLSLYKVEYKKNRIQCATGLTYIYRYIWTVFCTQMLNKSTLKRKLNLTANRWVLTT